MGHTSIQVKYFWTVLFYDRAIKALPSPYNSIAVVTFFLPKNFFFKNLFSLVAGLLPPSSSNGTSIKNYIGYSFRCEHKIFSPNLERGPSCNEAAPRLYCGAPIAAESSNSNFDEHFFHEFNFLSIDVSDLYNQMKICLFK